MINLLIVRSLLWIVRCPYQQASWRYSAPQSNTPAHRRTGISTTASQQTWPLSTTATISTQLP